MEQTSGGIGLLGMVFIVFLVLKLCNVITWSWWWVCLPLYGPLAITIPILLLIALVMVFAKK